MKALSLWQPWASAIALGLKTIETRSWSTAYRGPLAIHAARRRLTPAEEAELHSLITEVFDAGSAQLPSGSWPFQYGAIVATCELVEVRPAWRDDPNLTAQERRWGDFSPGRFAWVLADVKRVETVEPARGRQGLWEWTP